MKYIVGILNKILMSAAGSELLFFITIAIVIDNKYYDK